MATEFDPILDIPYGIHRVPERSQYAVSFQPRTRTVLSHEPVMHTSRTQDTAVDYDCLFRFAWSSSEKSAVQPHLWIYQGYLPRTVPTWM